MRHNHIKKRVFLNNYQRQSIWDFEPFSCGQEINKGVVKWLSSSYQVSKDVIYRIWRKTNQTGDVQHKKTKNCGRKRKDIDIEKKRDIPLHKRGSLWSLAKALEWSTTQLLKYLKEGVLRRHSSALKPHITDDNMKARLRFCLSMLEESSIPYEPYFKSMCNVVNIDEKLVLYDQKISELLPPCRWG